MAVKIVGRDESAVKRVTHKHCGSILEYVDMDVVPLYRGTDYSGGSDGQDGFMCPHCAQKVIIRSW